MFSKADLHIHTWYSFDSFSGIRKIIHQSIKRGLKIIAITDHDAIKGALRARDYVKKMKIPLQVIIGEEISSKGGHVIGLFLKKFIPPHLSLRETVRRIKSQNGLVIIPHLTFGRAKRDERHYRYRVDHQDLLENPDILEQVDAVEALNFTMFDLSLAPNVHKHAACFKKALVGGSDAHMSEHVGIAHTVFPGETLEDLKESIRSKTTKAVQLRPHHAIDWIWQHLAASKIPFSFTYYSARNFLKFTFSFCRKILSGQKAG